MSNASQNIAPEERVPNLLRLGRVYLSGPMTGIEDFNYPAFNAEAARLRRLGHEVENPAEGGPIAGAEWADYMRYDIPRLLRCERIRLLPGWTTSRGAKLELEIAKALGMAVEYAAGAERDVQPRTSQLSGQVCGGDSQHNTLNIALSDRVPWDAVPIGTSVTLVTVVHATQSVPLEP